MSCLIEKDEQLGLIDSLFHLIIFLDWHWDTF
jgi:hypothetical protein